MSDRYLYGKDFQREFIAMEDNKPFKLPSQTPTIYIFSTQPTRDIAQAGTGAAQTISTWNQDSASPYPCRYTVTAIDDPAPDDASPNSLWYWEAINYITKTAGQAQTSIRAFLLERGFQPSALPTVKPEDLADVYPAIADYLTTDQQRAMIENCLGEMIQELESRGIEYGRYHDQRKLKLALTYKVIAEGSLSQVKTPEDKFDYRYKVFSQKYIQNMQSLKLPYDGDGDGKPEVIERPRTNYWILDT